MPRSSDPDRQRFEAWVHRHAKAFSKSAEVLLERDADGSYTNPTTRGRWSAWREALKIVSPGNGSRLMPLPFVALPLNPTEDLLEALEVSGVRKIWCKDVYKALVETLLETAVEEFDARLNPNVKLPKVVYEGRKSTKLSKRRRQSNQRKISQLTYELDKLKRGVE